MTAYLNEGNLVHGATELRPYDITGTIPPSLGNFTALEVLDFSDDRNNLWGSLPPALGKLTNLRQLDVHQAMLTGTIPYELGNLRGLTDLILTGNQLEGCIPPCIEPCMRDKPRGTAYKYECNNQGCLAAELEGKPDGTILTEIPGPKCAFLYYKDGKGNVEPSNSGMSTWNGHLSHEDNDCSGNWAVYQKLDDNNGQRYIQDHCLWDAANRALWGYCGGTCCADGFYGPPGAGPAQCTMCPIDTFCPAHAETPQPCADGEASDAGSTECVAFGTCDSFWASCPGTTMTRSANGTIDIDTTTNGLYAGRCAGLYRECTHNRVLDLLTSDCAGLTFHPTNAPSTSPTRAPSSSPSHSPSASPSVSPTSIPSVSPSVSPSASPTKLPSVSPSSSPSVSPTSSPTIPGVWCEGRRACKGDTHRCSGAPRCVFQCDGWEACREATFECDAPHCIVQCTGSRACMALDVVPTATTQRVTFHCVSDRELQHYGGTQHSCGGLVRPSSLAEWFPVTGGACTELPCVRPHSLAEWPPFTEGDCTTGTTDVCVRAVVDEVQFVAWNVVEPQPGEYRRIIHEVAFDRIASNVTSANMPTASPTATIKIVECTGNNQCKEKPDLECTDDDGCLLVCDGTNACREATFTCTAPLCHVRCSAARACKDLTLVLTPQVVDKVLFTCVSIKGGSGGRTRQSCEGLVRPDSVAGWTHTGATVEDMQLLDDEGLIGTDHEIMYDRPV